MTPSLQSHVSKNHRALVATVTRAPSRGRKKTSVSEQGEHLVKSKDSSVVIQTSSQSVPSTPSWFGEVAMIAHYLGHLGVLSAVSRPS
jgi:hypothetical protein